MSLPNGQAETPAQLRSAQDAELSSFAPKRAREGGARRRAFPLRLPFAPRILPAHPTAPPVSTMSGVRASEADLPADDVVLKGVLAARPIPLPVPLPPLRDPLGHALGIVARLMVASCAAAAVAMLLISTIPRSSKVAAPEIDPNAALPADPVARASRVVVAEALPVDNPESAQPARVATISVRAPRASAPQAPAAAAPAASLSALDTEALVRLAKRGEDYLARGDIAAARLIFGRAVEAGDAGAALSLAATYDPEVLRRLNVLGVRPDIGQARAWYAKAADYGSIEAARRLTVLRGPDP